ncbi:serine/threonine kinase [Candidatus Vecturithrix granuli]|uniref:non-specific serine/threonine protein kinase n=1 Tax=Vecturithrix granuli TaxID=1499967 RepID=A0A081C6D1_VECG1|nr:serine/threonine kinase [Candidatus Vecturithrix granuli]
MDIGDILQHRYRIESILGQGSMGITYRAMDMQENRIVALKQLHFSRLQEWKPLELFEREVAILQKLNHPRIPAYIDYFTLESSADTQFTLVQEYVEGKTLQALVEGGWRGTEREILDIFLQLINILAYLHTLHPPVIHRDINPKNLLLSQTNEVYLVDFGAVQEKIRTTFLGGSTIVGTYGYVPFEQFSGQAVPASDYYAAGATLLYMLSHRPPADFPTEQYKPDFQKSLRISTQMRRLLNGLLEFDVSKRIASPDAVRNILENTFTTKAPTLTVKVAKPSHTPIKKIVKGQQHIEFLIPKRTRGKGITRILLGLLILGGLGGFHAGPFSLLGILLIVVGLDNLFGQSRIELSPQNIEIYTKPFGIGPPKTIPLSSLRKTAITGYFKKGLPGRKKKRQRSVLGINHEGQTLEIATNLTQAELEWLLQEFEEYLSGV